MCASDYLPTYVWVPVSRRLLCDGGGVKSVVMQYDARGPAVGTWSGYTV